MAWDIWLCSEEVLYMLARTRRKVVGTSWRGHDPLLHQKKDSPIQLFVSTLAINQAGTPTRITEFARSCDKAELGLGIGVRTCMTGPGLV